MSIGSHTLQAFFIQFKEHTGHGRTQVIVARGKQGLIDRRNQGRGHHGKRSCVVGRGFLREIVRIFTHYLVLTIITGDFNGKILVNIERQGLIGNVFQRIHQDFGRNTHFTTVFGFNFQLNTHHGLQVGGHYGQPVFFHFKEEIFKDR